MCGIVGFTHKYWTPDSDRIRQATDTLVHRGPDQQGVYRAHLVSLGATRLKILDLDSGDQPISTADGDLTIVFNGEIYNHLEVRAELESRGHTFRSHCDTETVLHAFLEWDTACFSRLRGMFAAALWSERRRRLVLARDRMGIKPLYVARHGRDLLFGSELKAILAHPEVKRRLSLRGLDCYLSLNYVPCPWTLVEGIEKLPPGHWMEWHDGATRTSCYWQLPFPAGEVQPDAEASLPEACEKLDSLLQNSIREHLLSDVPLGVWLSGGVDSSAILHYAAHAYSGRLKTFSISFRDRSFDETPYIQQAVQQYGTDHEQLDLNPGQDLESAIQEFAWFSDEPSADAGALPVWFLSRLCKRSVTVALSGEGADELFGGYLTYRANLLAARARRYPTGALKLALSLVQHWPVSDEKIGFEYKLKRFLQGALLAPEEAHAFWNGTFSMAQKARLLHVPLPGSFFGMLEQLREQLPATDGIAPFLWFDQRYYLADDILVKSDRMSMAHSVEVRPAFLDHRITEFAASLPSRWKVDGSRQKVVLKELMKHKLPAAILQRPKMGFDIPAHDWLRGLLRPLLLETLHEAREYKDLFRQSTIQFYLNRHLQRKENLGYHLWGLMVLFLWMKKWRIQPGSAFALPAGMPREIGASI